MLLHQIQIQQKANSAESSISKGQIFFQKQEPTNLH